MSPTPLIDAQFMQQAIRLAMRGRGDVEPNPMVGCAIVKEGRVIGQGWHRRYGGPHAEPNALMACTESTAGATAYVTLEPCCHTNKQTPPCVPQLIAAGLARIVIGCTDPNPDVAGRGIDQLRASGIDVDSGICQNEAKQLAAPFLLRMAGLAARPYVTLKWAQTEDGKIAGPGGARLQISNETSARVVHQLRARCDAILVGIRTVLADDPMLTARGVEPTRPLLRLVLDADLRTPLSSKLVQSAREVPTRIDCAATYVHSEQAGRLASMGVQIGGLDFQNQGRLSLRQMLSSLLPNTVSHLLVECGPTLAASFFEQGFGDRLWVVHSPRRVEDATAPNAAEIPPSYAVTGRVELAGDTLTEYLNTESPAFFANVPSADFLRVVESGG